MEFYSETKFYVVEKRATIEGIKKVQLKDQKGNNIIVNEDALPILLDSATNFKTTEKVTETELLAMCLSNPAKAMTIVFTKKDEPKTKKAFNEEISLWKENVKTAFLSKGISGLDEFATKPVLDYVPGEDRTIIGYPMAKQNDKDHLEFFEAGVEFPKQINTQNFKEVIVNNVKYIKK